MDGLSSMLNASLANARRYAPLRPSQNTIDNAAETIVGRLGFDPYTGGGQAFAHLIGSAYHMSPSMMGGILGVPDGSRFFSTIANGASGINRAAGYGQTDILNPYSVLASHRRTMDMAKTVYDLGIRKGGGYDVSFTHGLDMGEMGKVTQRLLSSDIAYRDEAGARLDPDDKDTSDKFRNNLKRLGSKFNEAASMLSKVTGSVEEALNLMDRMAGGNFLGGTAEQASKVAAQAKKMATAIRVTSAIAGVSPTEAYANMRVLQSQMAEGIGVTNGYISQASGVQALTGNAAYNATMAYQQWIAMNPNATQQQKDQARLAVNARAQMYMSRNGSALAAAIADNASLFSAEERRKAVESYRTGRPEAALALAKAKLGADVVDAYMKDPAMRIAAMQRAMKENPEFYNEMNQAGIEGNLRQAETYGARKMVGLLTSGIDSDLYAKTGNGNLMQERERAIKRRLAGTARKHLGLTDAALEEFSLDELRTALTDVGAYDAREENAATLAATREQIGANTMSAREEREAVRNLRLEIDAAANAGTLTRSKANSLKAKLDRNGARALDAAYKSLETVTRTGKEDLRRRVYGGKISSSEARNMIGRIERTEASQKGTYSTKERMDALALAAQKEDFSKMGAIKREALEIAQGDVIGRFEEKLRGMARADGLNLGLESGEKIGELSVYSASDMLASLFGDKLGDLKGDDLSVFSYQKAKDIIGQVRKGKAFNEAFADVMSNLSDDEKAKIGYGKLADGTTRAGQATVEQMVENARGGHIKNFNSQALLLKMASRVEGLNANNKRSIGEMKRFVENDVWNTAQDDEFRGNETRAIKKFDEKAAELEESGLVKKGAVESADRSASRRMISRLIGDKTNLKGKDLESFIDETTDSFTVLRKHGSSLQKALYESLKDVPKRKIAEKIGTEGLKQLKDIAEKAGRRELENFDAQTFLGEKATILDEQMKVTKKDALEEMRALSEGKIGQLSEKDAFDRFKSLARVVGGHGLDEKAFDAAGNAAGKLVDDKRKGSARRGIAQLLGKMNGGKGLRDDSFNAIAAAGSADSAAAIYAMSVAKTSGVGMSLVDLPKSWETATSKADDENANRTMNALSNVVHVGGMGFQKEAIESAKNQLAGLSDFVKGKDLKTLVKNASGSGDEAEQAKSKLKEMLKDRSDVTSDMAMLQALSGKNIGGEDALDVLVRGSGGLKKAMEKEGKNLDEKMVGIMREKARKDSPEYELGKIIGDFAAQFAEFVRSPQTIIDKISSVKVRVDGPVEIK